MRPLFLALLLPLAAAADTGPDQAPTLLPSTTVKSKDPRTRLRKAVEAGDPKAMYEMASDFEKGEEGFSQDLKKAFILYANAGARGNPDGYFRLGMIYDDGIGVDKDSPRALEYFKAAGSRGVVEAQYNVGTILVSARGGVKRDWVEGLAWLIVAKKNGAKGDGEAMVRQHLARHPDIIASAEQRANELLTNKPKFAPPDSAPPQETPAPEVSPPALDVPPTHVGPPGT